MMAASNEPAACRPSQEGRGLKPDFQAEVKAILGRPSQEGRGLKLADVIAERDDTIVAPRKRGAD